MKEISKYVSYEKKLEIYTLVTRFDEYSEMVKSAKNAGFDRDDIDFFYFDNKNSNDFDGFSGFNYAVKNSKAEYVIFCHQDVLFNIDGYEKFIECINQLNTIDSKWAIAGNAGKTINGNIRMKITDPHGSNQTFGPFPSLVISVDENFIVINNKYNLSCSHQMSGFHLYGIDICNNAIHLGLNCYVIDFHLTHNSKGNIDKSFFDSRRRFISTQQLRLQKKFYSTTCTNFYISSIKWINFIINKKYIMKVYSHFKRSINK